MLTHSADDRARSNTRRTVLRAERVRGRLLRAERRRKVLKAALASIAATAMLTVSLPFAAAANDQDVTAQPSEDRSVALVDQTSTTEGPSGTDDSTTDTAFTEDAGTPTTEGDNNQTSSDPADPPAEETSTGGDASGDGSVGDASGDGSVGEGTDDDAVGDLSEQLDTDNVGLRAMTEEPSTGDTGFSLMAMNDEGPPGTNEAKFIVKKGGFRSGSQVTSLEGAEFALYRAANSNDSGNNRYATTGPALDTCVTDADGLCYLYGSMPSNNNSDRRFVVLETSAPTPWTAVTSWGSGGSQAYAFKFSNINRNASAPQRTFYVPNSGTQTAPDQGRTWPDVYPNSALPAQCGLDIALVMDLSGSIIGVPFGTNYLNTYKDAAHELVDALAGTPSQMSILTFASQSPAANWAGADNGNMPLTSLNPANGTGRTALDAKISQLQVPNNSAYYYTNWDAAFRNAATTGEDYDVILFLTDGDPTTYGNGNTADTSFMLRNVEEAIHSANTAKADAHVIAVGIGGSVASTGGQHRLAQISGPDDYYTTDFDELGQMLREIASEACAGTLIVSKQFVDHNGVVIDENVEGWDFTASGLPGEETKTTDETGAVSFPIDFGDESESRQITVQEEDRPGYYMFRPGELNALCEVVGGGTVTGFMNVNPLGFAVDVAPNQTVSCIMQNVSIEATVEVEKRWIIDGVTYDDPAPLPEFSAELTLDPAPSNPPATFGTVHTGYSGTSDEGDGSVVEIGETVTVPPGCTTDDVAYESLSGASVNGETGVTAPLEIGANSYRITNTVTCETELTLTKLVANGTASATDWTLHATKPGDGDITFPSGDTGVTGPVTPGQPYALSETAKPGAANAANYVAAGWVCALDGGDPVAATNATVPLGHSMECTVTNQTATLYLAKIVQNDDGGAKFPSDWQLTATPTGTIPPGVTAQAVTGSTLGEPIYVHPGVTYALSESPASGVDGYTLTALECTATPNNSGSWQSATEVTLQALDTLHCRFINDDAAATLKLVKQVAPAEITDPTNWILTGIGDGSPTVTNPDGGSTEATPVKAGVEYALSEAPQEGFTEADEFEPSAWTCVVTNGVGSAPEVTGTGAGSATITGLALGQAVTCSITNTHTPPAVTHEKSLTSVTSRDDGTWDIAYTVTVTNPSLLASTTYSLEDELQFGDGVIVNSASAAVTIPPAEPVPVPDWTGLGSGTVLADGLEIAAEAQHTYTINVNALIANGTSFAPGGPLDCEAEVNDRAFLNRATLNDEVDRFACAEPVLPTLIKAPGTATAQPDGTWNVTYTLTVSNPSATTDVYYDLADAPGIVPGTTLNSASVEPAGNYSEPFGPEQHVINDGKLLAHGASDVYVVTINVSIPPTTPADDLLCLEGSSNGFVNEALLVASGQSIEDEACVGIPVPELDVDKSVVSTEQLPDGQWQVVYDVTVSNPTSTVGTYNLTDELRSGDGITGTVIDVTRNDVAHPWNDGVLATGTPLAGMSSDVYRITVTYNVLAGVTGNGTTGACPANELTGTGAFNNLATLVSGGETGHAADCSEPARPGIVKNFTDATQNPDGTWDVSYTLTVDNSPAGSKDAYYSLTDTPEFAAGVEIESWSVTGPIDPIDGLYTDGIIIPADPPQLISAGATHVYTVTFTVDVDAGTTARECTGEPGAGFFNAAFLATGNDVIPVDDCGPIQEQSIPTVAKSVDRPAFPRQNADGNWEIEYTVTVSNVDGEFITEYDLDDELDFGFGPTLTVVSASVTSNDGVPTNADWNGVSDTVVATGVTIGAGETHTYSVEVVVSLAEGAFEEQSATCSVESETPKTGGFLNIAIITVGETVREAFDCDEPAQPEFTKSSAGAPVPGTEPGVWSLSYTLTATNDSSVDLYYSLDDTLEFPNGVTVSDPQVTTTSAVTITPGWNGAGQPNIVDTQLLEAGAEHVFTVTVTATVSEDTSADALLCEGDKPGNGFLNTAVLTSGNEAYDDTACLDIPVRLIVDKTWIIDGTQYDEGDQPDGFEATLELSVVPFEGAPVWGDFVDGYELGTEVAIDESLAMPEACSLVSNEGTGKVTLAAAVNVFEVVNVVDCTQTLKLNKQVVNMHGGDAVATDWTVSASSVGDPSSDFSGEGSASGAVDLGVGYLLDETSSEWTDGVEYDVLATWQCTSPQGDDAFVLVPGDNDRKATVTVTMLGATVECIIENTDIQPTLSMKKIVEPSEIASDFPSTLWYLTASDEGGPVIAGDGAATGAVDSNVAYTLAEFADFTGSEEFDPSDWTCAVTNGVGTAGLNGDQVTLQPGQEVECEITNTARPAEFEIDKQVVSATQETDGTWQIEYQITVSNFSVVSPVVYDLDDTLEYGAGIDINAASWTGPNSTNGTWSDPANEPTASLAEGVVLSGGSDPHVYVVTVNATVTAEAWANGTTECLAEPEAGGFLNVAVLTVDGLPHQADACDEPAVVTVSKSVVEAPEYQGDGNWLIDYEVTVTNVNEKPLYYDLDDEPVFPDGVEIVVAVATDPDGNVLPQSEWNGTDLTTLAVERQIDANTVETWRISITANASMITSIDEALCVAESSGGGFFNRAVLNNGTILTVVDDCADIPVGELVLIKHVDNSAFDGLDHKDYTLATAGDWTLIADGELMDVAAIGNEEGTAFVVPVGDYAVSESISAGADNPLLEFYTAGPWSCEPVSAPNTLMTAVAVSGLASVVPGASVTCEITNTGQPVDLVIEKHDGGEIDGQPAVPTDVDARYQYTFTVTNAGVVAAPNTVVTDVIPETIAVDTATWVIPEGWTAALTDADSNGFGGTLTFTKDLPEPFAPGDEAVFTFWVTTAPDLPREGGEATARILDIVNTAEVTSDGIEETPGNNISTEETPVKSIAVDAVGLCVADLPVLDWNVTPWNVDSVVDPVIVLIWWTQDAFAERDPSIPASDTEAILADGASQVDMIVPPATAESGVTITGEQLWPGAAANSAGDAIAWPGWRLLPTGQWVLDPSSPFYDLRSDAIIEVRMNPSTAAVEAYPPATPYCNPNPSSSDSRPIAVTGFDNGWMLWTGAGLLTAGTLLVLGMWLRRRATQSSPTE